MQPAREWPNSKLNASFRHEPKMPATVVMAPKISAGRESRKNPIKTKQRIRPAEAANTITSARAFLRFWRIKFMSRARAFCLSFSKANSISRSCLAIASCKFCTNSGWARSCSTALRPSWHFVINLASSTKVCEIELIDFESNHFSNFGARAGISSIIARAA